jgi:putative PIN family toxin of toxin-antitoxin system
VRFVFDTNILISASLLPDSLPASVLKQGENKGLVLYSEDTLAELFSVLQRPKFKKYIDDETLAELLAQIQQNWINIPILQTVQVCRDPKDNKFLDLALNGEADYLITGDDDLLELHPFQGISILTPRAFSDLEI